MNAQFDPEVVTSRRALIDVVIGLEEQREALTVLGGHAVIEVTQGLPSVPPADSTSDGDLGVTPQLLADLPRLEQRMTELGYEQARPERPGIWSPVAQRDRDVHLRDTVDLIAPMSLARGDLMSRRPIRAARIGAHGRRAVSAAQGTELSTVDRRLRRLRSFDDGPDVHCYVAGPAALLCAKAYKIEDRRRPSGPRNSRDRLRPKDYADLYRLLLVSEPGEVAQVFSQGAAAPSIREVVIEGRTRLVAILTDTAGSASMVADAWAAPERETEFRATIEEWLLRFTATQP